MDEFYVRSLKKYEIIDIDFSDAKSRKCIYEDTLAEYYYQTHDGYYIRDPVTKKHIAIAQENEVQSVEKVEKFAEILRISHDPVSFRYDPIGTLYITNLGYAIVSVNYSDDYTTMSGVYPDTGTMKSVLTPDMLKYASYV